MPVKSKSTKTKTKKTTTKKAVSAKTAGGKNVSAFFAGLGRRKTAVARVRLTDGKGVVTVNGKSLKVFFPDRIWQRNVLEPLTLTGLKDRFDVSLLTHGGGMSSQSEAARHGIARALEKFDASLRPTLKKAGLLTRDAREKERKKYGLKRARRAPQFSKR